MNHIKLIGVVLALIVIIVGGIFVSRSGEKEIVLIEDTPVQNEESIKIEAQHQFKDGKHILAGSIELPTPCHTLSQQIAIAESYPEQVTIELNSESAAEACIQVITEARFKIEFSAHEDASMQMLYNGKKVNLILTPATSDLENFSTFIKG